MNTLRRILRWSSFVSTGAVIVVMLATTADSAGRYLFSRPISGVVESTDSLLVVMVFMALAYAQVLKQHVSAGILVQHFRPEVQRAIDIFNQVVLILLLAVLTMATTQSAYDSFRTGEIQWNLPYPMWIPRSFVPLGIFLLLLEFVAEFIETVSIRGRLRSNR